MQNTHVPLPEEVVSSLKARARARLDELDAELKELNLRIHHDPEFGFEERKASSWLVEFLARRGFRTELGVAGLPTAFRASHRGGRGGPRVAIMVEYDALPATGHGCGHSMIGPIGAGAAAALKDVWEDHPGELLVLGTPAEEEGGGKVFMAKEGAFNGLDAVMIAHPTNMTIIGGPSLAMRGLEVEFIGKVAHACSNPHMGVNALSALLHMFNLIDAQRQHFDKDIRVNGVITNGGEAPNIVPGYASARFQLMAPSDRALEALSRRVSACAMGAATAFGAEVRLRETITYKAKWPNAALGRLLGRCLDEEGLSLDGDAGELGWGYTDTGDVSHIAPTVSVYFKIAGPRVFNHTRAFADAVTTEFGQAARARVTKALACALIELLANPAILADARAEFDATRARAVEEVTSEADPPESNPTAN